MVCNKDSKLITCALCLDMNKAFDCIGHNIVLQKSFHYGVLLSLRGFEFKTTEQLAHKPYTFWHQQQIECRQRGSSIIIWLPYAHRFKSSFLPVTCGVSLGNDIAKTSKCSGGADADGITLHISRKQYKILHNLANDKLTPTLRSFPWITLKI